MDADRRALSQTQGNDSGAVSAEAGLAGPHTYFRLAPARTPSIADSLVLKDGDLFFLFEPNGDVPIDEVHATGLYYHDCRFLDGYELRMAGHPLEMLVSTAGRGYQSLVELTNPELIYPSGEVVAPFETIGVRWIRTLDGEHLALHDSISLRNLDHRPVAVPVTLAFRARFQDVFNVRSLTLDTPGVLRPARVAGELLGFEYEGADGLARQVTVTFCEPPQCWKGTTACFSLSLGPREERTISLVVQVAEGPGTLIAGDRSPVADRQALIAHHLQAEQEWRAAQTDVQSSSPLLDAIIDRSLRDLHLLRSSINGNDYFAAGVPWFATLFGRDSIIAALQTLAFDPAIARETLRVLAAFQGTKEDPWREEQPGKILHELRVGELAHLGRIPQSPYFGSVDATPLFLILAAEYFSWTGDRGTIDYLRPHLDAASDWLEKNLDADGYLTYRASSPDGLVNHGWKDSDIGVPNADGRPAEPPIALVEVQAYAYLARVRLADLYRRLGEAERADLLEQEAAALRDRFNQDFWMEPRGCYALALQRGGSQVRVCSSNVGHVLWTGIATTDHARRVKKRLMRPDMFSGWGIRTLSQREVAYSPVGYHVGTVWPHDNSFALAGLRRYGFDAAALRLFSGLTEAAMHFELYRLPELFAGFSRTDYEVPVRYPLASKPQAWAAGAVPWMLTNLLGLQPEADCGRLNVTAPVLPESVDWLELKGLRVGSGEVHLRFERTPHGVAVEVQRKEQPVEVVITL